MRAVIFDLGHTLIDYYHDWNQPESKAVSRLYDIALMAGTRMEKDEFTAFVIEQLNHNRDRKAKEMLEIPLASVLESVLIRAGCDVDDELILEGLEVFYQTLQEDRRLVPGTIEMLEKVREKGYRIGLISDVAWGLPSEYPLRDICYYRLDTYFDDMIFSTDVGLRKPHPRLFKLALYNLSSDVEGSMYVGNSLQADVAGAKGVGLRAVLKSSSYYFADENIVPDAKIDVWEDLLSLL